MKTKNGKTAVVGMASFFSIKMEGRKIFACRGVDVSYFTRINKFWNWVKTYIADDYCELNLDSI